MVYTARPGENVWSEFGNWKQETDTQGSNSAGTVTLEQAE